jgi:hypothetical protein
MPTKKVAAFYAATDDELFLLNSRNEIYKKYS